MHIIYSLLQTLISIFAYFTESVMIISITGSAINQSWKISIAKGMAKRIEVHEREQKEPGVENHI